MENTSAAASGPNLQALWESLKSLVKPASSHDSEGIKDLRGVFQLNLKKATAVLGFEVIQEIPHLGVVSSLCGSDLIWDFVKAALFVLLSLKEQLQNDDIGVSQQKDIRSCLQFLVSLGIRPNIVPNVLPNVSDKTASLDVLQDGVTTEMQKYERLCAVVKAFLTCCEHPNFRSLIIANVINPFLGALFQLSFAPLKKPSPDVCSSSSVENSFTMTPDIWNKLQKDKLYFRTLLQQLVKETYQPKIIFELMMLQSSQKDFVPPMWLKKSSSNLLTACVIQEGGVAALIKATFDAAPDTGSDWKKIDTVARIITSPVQHYRSIANQLLKLIELPEDGAHEIHYVVLTCIKHLLEKDAVICHKLIIEPLMQPLTYVFSHVNDGHEEGHTLLHEDKVDLLVKQMHLCFTSSGSKASSVNLPGLILSPYVSFFFSLFCKVHGSVSNVFKYSEDILYHIFCDNNPAGLVKILKCLLLREEDEEIHVLPKHYGFQFGPTGGVSLQICPEPSTNLLSSAVEESGDMVMALLEKKNDSELLISVFEVLLKMFVEMGMKPKPVASNSTSIGTLEDNLASLMLSSEKHLGVVRLLAALVENSSVRQKLSEKPGPILTFVLNCFETLTNGGSLPETSEDDDLECVFVAFMVLNVILDNCDENTDWSLFKPLLKPVSVIRDRTRNDELKRLASRVYNIVSTSGIENDSNPTNLGKCKTTRCEEALHDACDPLLPVRGHALVQLTKLIQQRDVETLAKREAVLCLFKENLSNSDSFIYLAAINGMVAFAAVEPNVAVRSLTQEYVAMSTAGEGSPRNPELRMKVGEILVKLVRELGPLAPKYKNELLNAFLIGAKDTDHLMRASSLSNLGEVCQILGFRIGPVLRELLMCIQSILRHDKAVEPRRASVMVVTHLLRGLEADTLTVLQDAALELYRHLKSVYCDDADEVVRLHAQLALEELGRLAKDFLFPRIPAGKKIQILP